MRPFLLAIFVLTFSFSLQAAPSFPSQVPSNSSAPYSKPAWLGVLLRPLPEALRVQLTSLMPQGQGVLVERVEPDSPAHKAGIQRFDILLAMDDQLLYSAGQLSRLVASSPAGKTVQLTLLRDAAVKTLDVVLASWTRAAPPNAMPNWRGQYRPVPPMFDHRPPSPPSVSPYSGWDKFESIEVRTLKDGRFRATVSFKDKADESRSFTFEGTRKEIMKQIQQQKDLPEQKRQALMDALNLRMDGLPMMPPRFGFNNRWLDSLFDDPFFSSPFRYDPFFNDPFFNPPGYQGGAPYRGSPPTPPWPPRYR